MKKRYLAASLSFFLAPLVCAFPQAQTPLDKALAQMDKTSASFKNVTATIKVVVYLKLIHGVSETQTGTTYFEHSNGTVQTGASLRTEGSTAKPKIIEYINGNGRMFSPTPNELVTFKSNADAAQAALGLGGSGKDLSLYWKITDQGAETVDNKTTEKLDLVPKDPKQAQTLSHVTVWIDMAQGVSVKQIFYLPNGDNRTVTYTDIKLSNGKLNKDAYAIHTNKDTKVTSTN